MQTGLCPETLSPEGSGDCTVCPELGLLFLYGFCSRASSFVKRVPTTCVLVLHKTDRLCACLRSATRSLAACAMESTYMYSVRSLCICCKFMYWPSLVGQQMLDSFALWAADAPRHISLSLILAQRHPMRCDEMVCLPQRLQNGLHKGPGPGVLRTGLRGSHRICAHMAGG